MTDDRPNEKYAFSVSLTRIEDGKTVECYDEFGFPGYVRGSDWEEDCVNIWIEGNNCCDCNRQFYFERAEGSVDPQFGECGEEAFRVNWIRIQENGHIVYEDGK